MSAACIAAFTTGCAPQFAYQVMETRPEAALAPAQPALHLTYDFWNPNGQVGATLTNTTTGPVYLDLNRSHLIVNGAAYTYYSDTEYSSTETIGRSVSRGRTGYNSLLRNLESGGAAASMASSSSLRVRPKAVVEIPPSAHLAVQQKPAIGGPVNTCELSAYDHRRNAVVMYDSATTPLRFRFYFTYSTSPELSALQVLDYGFRVGKITAMMSSTFYGPTVPDKDPCSGKRLMTTSSTYPFANSQNLYVGFPITGFNP